MNNTEYVEKMFSNAERILVDTSTLMDPRFQDFLLQNKEFLKSYGKPIVVIKSVYAELIRKMRDEEEETVQAATEAVGLLDMNKDLFQIDCSSLTDDEIKNAFADPQLLSTLTLQRRKSRQLLIVNDKGLGMDAYNLNYQESCKGHRVYVCYIDRTGKLQCCDCVRNKTGVVKSETAQVTHDTTIQVTRIEKSPKSVDKNDSEWQFDWKSGVMVATGTIALYGLYRLIKAIA